MGYASGFVSGAGQGAAAGAMVGGPVGAVIGGAIGGVFGGLAGQSASRARKWQRIAAQRQAEWNALKNRRQFLQGVREQRAVRASQLQATSGDLTVAISGAQGSLASLGSQFEYDFLQFDKDLWYEDYVNSALRNAGAAASKSAQYSNTLSGITNIAMAVGTAQSFGSSEANTLANGKQDSKWWQFKGNEVVERGGGSAFGVSYSRR